MDDMDVRTGTSTAGSAQGSTAFSLKRPQSAKPPSGDTSQHPKSSPAQSQPPALEASKPSFGARPPPPPALDGEVTTNGISHVALQYLLSDAPALAVNDTPDRGKILESRGTFEPGDLIFNEKPVLAVTQASASPTLFELQEWVNSFAALESTVRTDILQLCCPDQAAAGGHLASVLGLDGDGASTQLRCPASVTSEELWRFLRVLECNSFQVSTEDGRCRVELLLTTSRTNHSCLPNALRGPGSSPGMVEIRALRPVAAGEEISISYVDEEILTKPTGVRHERLRNRWQFRCGCVRCAAPDMLRAFRCPSCRGMVLVAPDGRSFAPCRDCGTCLSTAEADDAMKAEQELAECVPDAVRDAQVTAGAVQSALERRDGPGFEKASEAAVKALGKCAAAAAKHPQVLPAHHLVVALAKAASTLRAVLGDGLMAGGREDMAKEYWRLAAAEMQEAIEAEYTALPIPRDGRIADLIGLGGFHRRLDKVDACRGCLSESLEAMRLTYWACEPQRKAAAQAMQQGVQAAVAEM